MNNNALFNLPSMKNFVEGWNRVFQDSLNHVSHPDIFKLIVALQKEILTQEINFIRINCGEKLSIPKLRETGKWENSFRLVSSYNRSQHGQQPRLEFLKGIAQSMYFGE
jgi:hypothetical protein